MAVPIQQIHTLHAQGILADSSPLEEVVGTVKNFYPPKAGEYGPMQNLVLGDETGEIQVMISGRQGDPLTALPPIQRGDMLTLFSSVNSKNQRVGLVKKSYDGRAQLKVSASNVRNSSAPVATQPQAYGQAPGLASIDGGTYPAALSMLGEPVYQPMPGMAPPLTMREVKPQQTPSRTKLGESEVRRLWLRQVYELGGAFVDVGEYSDLATKLPAHVFIECCKAATTILMGIQKGDITIEEGLSDEVQGGGMPWE